jgi:REP-associated tyrosine transposase
MARPLRLEFPGSIWHVTARGNERRSIVLDDSDRMFLLDLLGQTVERFRWIVYQYVLMTNHYHLVFQLSEETLSSGMRWLNGRYAQAFNRRHARVGHLFQGRFHARLVEKESYLQEVMRYVVLNPVRAKIVSLPEDYAWSSHRATAGLRAAPSWLAVDRTLSCFAPEPTIARTWYTRFVDEGIGIERSPWRDVVGQIYLGRKEWVEGMREKIESKPRSDDYPIAQRTPIVPTMMDVIAAVASGLSVSENLIRFGRGGRARMLAAWIGCHQARLDLRSIAAALRVRSTGGISKLIGACEERLRQDPELQSAADRCLACLRQREKVKSEALTPTGRESASLHTPQSCTHGELRLRLP